MYIALNTVPLGRTPKHDKVLQAVQLETPRRLAFSIGHTNFALSKFLSIYSSVTMMKSDVVTPTGDILQAEASGSSPALLKERRNRPCFYTVQFCGSASLRFLLSRLQAHA